MPPPAMYTIPPFANLLLPGPHRGTLLDIIDVIPALITLFNKGFGVVECARRSPPDPWSLPTFTFAPDGEVYDNALAVVLLLFEFVCTDMSLEKSSHTESASGFPLKPLLINESDIFQNGLFPSLNIVDPGKAAYLACISFDSLDASIFVIIPLSAIACRACSVELLN